jgi:hypothetical protein
MSGSATAPIVYSDMRGNVAKEDWNSAWSREFATRVVTAATDTATFNDHTIVGNRGTDITLTLPSATGTGKILVIGNIGVGNLVATSSGSDTIDGDATQTLEQWDTMQICDYASGTWKVI